MKKTGTNQWRIGSGEVPAMTALPCDVTIIVYAPEIRVGAPRTATCQEHMCKNRHSRSVFVCYDNTVVHAKILSCIILCGDSTNTAIQEDCVSFVLPL